MSIVDDTVPGVWLSGHGQRFSGPILSVEDPSTARNFAYCSTCNPDIVDQAVYLAHQAFRSGVWSKASRHHRADVLDRAAGLLQNAMSDLIALEVRQTGRPIREMRAQVPSLVRWFKYYAAMLRTEECAVLPTVGKLHNWVERIPLGVVAHITPFNHPLLIAVKKLAPALAAGNSVILKPSDLAPLTVLHLGRLLKEAGIPDNVFVVICGAGSTGSELVSNPLIRKVDFTGSTKTGKAVGEIAGKNLAKYTAELGGKAPALVFEKADLDVAVNGIAFGAFIASGQTCVATTRVLVDQKIFPELVQRLKSKAESITRRIGRPDHPECTMGPLITARQLESVDSMVREAVNQNFAQIITGGERMSGSSPLDGFDLSRGYYYPPTILVSSEGDSVRQSKLWSCELFGPVVVVVGFKTETDAIELANDSEYGLGAGIWTQDLAQAHRVAEQIEAGIVWVNTHHRNDPSSPWGGAKVSSGVGSENGVDAYREYTMAKSTVINYASVEEMAKEEDWFGEVYAGVRYG